MPKVASFASLSGIYSAVLKEKNHRDQLQQLKDKLGLRDGQPAISANDTLNVLEQLTAENVHETAVEMQNGGGVSRAALHHSRVGRERAWDCRGADSRPERARDCRRVAERLRRE